MNFVIIMNDTLRPDHLSAYGNDWCVTPNFGAFARTAAVFDKCYVGSFATIPNRTDLFTGRFGEPIHPWLPLFKNGLDRQPLLFDQPVDAPPSIHRNVRGKNYYEEKEVRHAS